MCIHIAQLSLHKDALGWDLLSMHTGTVSQAKPASGLQVLAQALLA